MTQTHNRRSSGADAPRTTWIERLIVLGGFATAALCTSVAVILGTGMESIGPLWLAAVVWTVPASLALALRRGFVRGDWSAFRNREFPDDSELIDWTTQTGEYAWMAVAEEHERLMRSN